MASSFAKLRPLKRVNEFSKSTKVSLSTIYWHTAKPLTHSLAVDSSRRIWVSLRQLWSHLFSRGGRKREWFNLLYTVQAEAAKAYLWALPFLYIKCIYRLDSDVDALRFMRFPKLTKSLQISFKQYAYKFMFSLAKLLKINKMLKLKNWFLHFIPQLVLIIYILYVIL